MPRNQSKTKVEVKQDPLSHKKSKIFSVKITPIFINSINIFSPLRALTVAVNIETHNTLKNKVLNHTLQLNTPSVIKGCTEYTDNSQLISLNLEGPLYTRIRG